MSLRRLKAAFQYHIALTPPYFVRAIRDRRNYALAAYIFEQDGARLTREDLEQGLIWLGAAKSPQTEDERAALAARIGKHPQAAYISTSVMTSCLLTAADEHEAELFAALVNFPTVKDMDDSQWDQVLFYALPKGHPDKKRMETRDFDDRDGHPDILWMLEIVRQGHATARKRSSTPKP